MDSQLFDNKMAEGHKVLIVNQSYLSDKDVKTAIKNVNRQILDDFSYIWGDPYECVFVERTKDQEIAHIARTICLIDDAFTGLHEANDVAAKAVKVRCNGSDLTVILAREVVELVEELRS